MTNTDGSSTFERECLRAHNFYRALHGCPAMKIDKKLNKEAQSWAQHLLDTNTMEHSQKPGLGENLYMATNFKVTGDIPVKSWYDEIKDYDYSAATFSSGTSHFTQVVWKNSTHLGVGYATKKSVTFVVANYTSPGNVLGKFKENVPPLLMSKSKKESEVQKAARFLNTWVRIAHREKELKKEQNEKSNKPYHTGAISLKYVPITSSHATKQDGEPKTTPLASTSTRAKEDTASTSKSPPKEDAPDKDKDKTDTKASPKTDTGAPSKTDTKTKTKSDTQEPSNSGAVVQSSFFQNIFYSITNLFRSIWWYIFGS